jgi:hypothetical protein
MVIGISDRLSATIFRAKKISWRSIAFKIPFFWDIISGYSDSDLPTVEDPNNILPRYVVQAHVAEEWNSRLHRYENIES